MGSFHNHFESKEQLFEAAVAEVRDARLALVTTAGSALFLGELLHEEPDRDDGEASDQLAEDLLRMFGVPAKEAHALAHRPLPDLWTGTSAST